MSQDNSNLTGAAGELLIASRLLQQGFGVARPVVDDGIDLFAYSITDPKLVVPVQVKTYSNPCVNFEKTWWSRHQVLLITVWLKPAPRFFLFSNLEDVEQCLGDTYRNSNVWSAHNGRYAVNKNKFQPAHDERFRPFEDAWEKVEQRINVVDAHVNDPG